jgi:hypothetical protein
MPPSGGACFVCEVSNDATADLDGHADCSRCGPTVKLDWKHMQRVLEHMGVHILYDRMLNSSEEQCGLCLRPAPMCQVYLTKACRVSRSFSVDRAKSTCPNLVCFNYKSAAQSSDRSPCSNVPITCCHCPAGSPAVWTYSLHAHYWGHHQLTSVVLFPTQVELSQSEKDGMKRVWATHFNQRKSYFKKKRSTPIAISEAHRSRFLIA